MALWSLKSITDILSNSQHLISTRYIGDFIDQSGLSPLSSSSQALQSGPTPLSSSSTEQIIFQGINSDSRSILKGELFIALKGDQFDGHDYILQAIEKGASGILIHKKIDSQFLEPLFRDQVFRDQVFRDQDLLLKFTTLASEQSIVFLEVSDTLKALQELASQYRKKLSATVIAITGSNGKTTSKEFTAQICSPYRSVHASQGSYNNHWGVPFTILKTPETCQILVLEMGMNHPGEIKQLCQIATPDIVVCTSVGRAHLEHLENEIQIAHAKEEIYLHSPSNSIRIFNLDNPHTLLMYRNSLIRFPSAKAVTFSDLNSGPSRPEQTPTPNVQLGIKGVSLRGLLVSGYIGEIYGEAFVPIFGTHHLTNIMVAACSALAAGLRPNEIWSSLPLCHAYWGRSQWIPTANGLQILFDAYNANPDSMKALITQIPLIKANLDPSSQIIGIFGEMLEMGQHAEKVHFELGQLIANAPFDQVYFLGPSEKSFRLGFDSALNELFSQSHQQSHSSLSEDGLTEQKPALTRFQSHLTTRSEFSGELPSLWLSHLGKNDILVLKGSRGMKLERFLDPFISENNKDYRQKN